MSSLSVVSCEIYETLMDEAEEELEEAAEEEVEEELDENFGGMEEDDNQLITDVETEEEGINMEDESDAEFDDEAEEAAFSQSAVDTETKAFATSPNCDNKFGSATGETKAGVGTFGSVSSEARIFFLLFFFFSSNTGSSDEGKGKGDLFFGVLAGGATGFRRTTPEVT